MAGKKHITKTGSVFRTSVQLRKRAPGRVHFAIGFLLQPKTVSFYVKILGFENIGWCMVSSCTSMPFKARACLIIHKSKIEMTSLKDKFCSKALKLCFDAMCDRHYSFCKFKVISYNFDSFEKVFKCKCPELELSLKSSTLQHRGNHIMGMSPKFATYIETWKLHQSYAFQVVFFGVKRNPAMFFLVSKKKEL